VEVKKLSGGVAKGVEKDIFVKIVSTIFQSITGARSPFFGSLILMVCQSVI